MGVFNRKGTVRDGLVLELDAANQKSWGADQTKWKDTTSQGNDGTLTNGPVHSQGPFPGAGYVTFDGTDDYLTTTYSTSEFRWWDTDYTIEAWIYPTTLTDWYDGSARPALVGNMDHTGMTNYWSFGPYNSSGNINFYYWNGSAQDAMVSTESVTANSWNHIAFIKNSSGCKIFVNGVGTNYMAISGTPQDSTSYNLTVGAYYNSDINGYVSNLRIVKGTALYTSNFTPQLSELTAIPNTKLLTCQKGTITDASVSGHSITVTGNAAAVYNDVSYFDFDGVDDFISFTDSTDFQLGAGDFTYETWVQITGTFMRLGSVINDADNGASPNFTLKQNEIYIYSTIDGGYLLQKTISSSTNTWYHIVFTRIGTDINLYRNGSLIHSVSSISTNFVDDRFVIGRNHAGTAYATGHMTLSRLYKGKGLTATEVKQNFNAHRARFGI